MRSAQQAEAPAHACARPQSRYGEVAAWAKTKRRPFVALVYVEVGVFLIPHHTMGPRRGHDTAQRALMAFHHIRSSKKISTLHAWAHELTLQGILKIGWPGVVLVADRAMDGRTNVAEYVRRIKRLPWHTCELRAIEPLACAAQLQGLHAALHAPAQASRFTRRSGLVQLDSLKPITPLLRDADAQHAGVHHGAACDDASWEAFYRAALWER